MSAETPFRQELFKRRSWQSVWENLIENSLLACALLSVFTTAAIVFILFNESIYSVTGDRAFLQNYSLWSFLSGTGCEWQHYDNHFGLLPLLTSTIRVTLIGSCLSIPLGLTSAVYLSEYASPKARRILKPTLELLSGIPSIVLGFFALTFITPILIQPFFALFGIEVGAYNALAAGIAVGLMTVPIVASLSEDAIRAVPQALREAGYALGSTKFDVSVKIVIPAAFSGIVAACLLAISRAIGETMAVTLAGGLRSDVTLNPLKECYTMTAYIAGLGASDVEAGGMETKSLYMVGLALFLLTLTMNILSQWVMRRYRETYQ
jgi:phosphate transport system permease protein